MSTDRLTSRTVSSAISAKHPSRADKEGYLPPRRSQAQTSIMLDECTAPALHRSGESRGREAAAGQAEQLGGLQRFDPAPSRRSRLLPPLGEEFPKDPLQPDR